MRFGLWAILFLLSLMASVRAEPLILTEFVDERVRDEGQFMSTVSRAILSDYLDSISQTQQLEIYVVILPKTPLAEAARDCDRWQKEWVPKGRGGVFVYSVPDKKYCFTPTPETVETAGAEKLQELFLRSVQDPPVRESFDVVISLPVMRMVALVGQERLQKDGQRADEAESQMVRWQIIAAIVGAFALLGWILCLSRLVQNVNWGGSRLNIPPPGMAYRNPPRRSRSGRKSREGEGNEGGERRSRNDRF